MAAWSERGTTLVELTLGLALATCLLAAVTAAWMGAQQVHLLGVGSAELQQTLRATLDLMAREIRAAGRDVTLCAFDFAPAGGGSGTGDCSIRRRETCRCRLNGGTPPCPSAPYDGCASVFVLPWTDVSATALRIRSDRDGDGRIDATGEEDVRYAWSSGAPPCPPGVARCLTREAGSGAMALTAVEITHFRLTYFPRPGFGACARAGGGASEPCPPLSLPLAGQHEADGIGRIRIEVTAVEGRDRGLATRTLTTDVTLRNRT